MRDDDVTRLELGHPRRRWWPFVVVGLVAWGVAALVLGGSDDEPSAEPGPTTVTSAGPSPSTTSPGPVLAGGTGLALVVTGSEPRVIDLDTGATRAFDPGVVTAARPDGLVVTRGGRLVWWPAPFAEGTTVDLGPSGGTVHVVPGFPAVWVVTPLAFPEPGSEAWLVHLEDGRRLRTVPLPREAHGIGVTAGGGLVVDAAGDGFVLGADGSRRRVDGAPVVVVGDVVVARACDDELRCGFVGTDVTAGTSRALPGLDRDRWWPAGPTRDGAAVLGVVEVEPDGLARRAVLVTLDGLRPALPPQLGVRDRLRDGSWTPDGLLLVPFANEVHVVDPDADGGPATVATFALDPPPDGQLYVVSP